MEQETFPNESNATLEDDAVVRKIKAVNTKTITSALILAIVIAIIFTFNSPFSKPFFGLFGLLAPFIVVACVSFVFLYQILFYAFGHTLVAEAKKRNLFLIKNYILTSSHFEHSTQNHSMDDRPVDDAHPMHPLSHHYED